jgi:hypothetical protein
MHLLAIHVTRLCFEANVEVAHSVPFTLSTSHHLLSESYIMPDTDSPLSITASVIAIITLVYAVAITLEIYARALRQAEHDNDVLVQAFIQNETGLLGVQEILENLTKRRRQVDTASRSTTNDLALQILMGQSNELYKTAWKCMDDWDKLERLEPIRRKFDYLLVLQIRRSSGYQNWSQERCFATDMRQKAKVWLKFCFLFGIFLLIYLPFALLYNMGVFLHSVTFYNAFVFHIRMMQKQKELTDKMQKVGSNLAELRSQVLLR